MTLASPRQDPTLSFYPKEFSCRDHSSCNTETKQGSTKAKPGSVVAPGLQTKRNNSAFEKPARIWPFEIRHRGNTRHREQGIIMDKPRDRRSLLDHPAPKARIVVIPCQGSPQDTSPAQKHPQMPAPPSQEPNSGSGIGWKMSCAWIPTAAVGGVSTRISRTVLVFSGFSEHGIPGWLELDGVRSNLG